MPLPNSFMPRQHRHDPRQCATSDVGRLRRVRLNRLGCAQRHDVEAQVRYCLARGRASDSWEVPLGGKGFG